MELTSSIPDIWRSTLLGSVERVSYFNSENGQCLLEFKNSMDGQILLISGYVPWAYPGMSAEIQLKPNSSISPYQAEKIIFSAPTSATGVRRFLRSGAFPGIGPQLIKILAGAFSDNFFLVLQDWPEALSKVSGIGPKKKKQILEAWQEYNAKNEMQKFLFDNKLPLAWGSTLWAEHRLESKNFFLRNPYWCAYHFELPFELVDEFALSHGFSLEHPDRIKYAILTALNQQYKQGHCAMPEKHLMDTLTQQLEVSTDKLEQTLELQILQEEIVVEKIRGIDCLYLRDIWLLEQEVATKLLAFTNKSPIWGWINTDKLIQWAQNILSIDLAPLQREAIETALSSALTVITGGPGTGKTTLIRSLVTILQTQFARFALCSPTGRAAQRLGEATGMPATTIHRLLKVEGGQFVHHAGNPLNYDLVLVDEASMVDLTLMSHLLNALPSACALILVGDVDQIPSVGAGNILSSLISSEKFQVVRLTDSYRQKRESLIKQNAERINRGEMPWTSQDERGDFHYLPVKDSNHARAVVKDLVHRVLPERYGIDHQTEMQILLPLNRGDLGTQSFNLELQNDVSLPASAEVQLGQNFRQGDKVMAIKNDYTKDVFNGDIGFIDRIDLNAHTVVVRFGDRPVAFDFEELDRLTLAYAITIHKSQGSEYRAVIVVITNEHLPMLQRHLVYTAVTRGKEQVFLVAEPSALQKALDSTERRWERLTEMLQGTYPATLPIDENNGRTSPAYFSPS